MISAGKVNLGSTIFKIAAESPGDQSVKVNKGKRIYNDDHNVHKFIIIRENAFSQKVWGS